MRRLDWFNELKIHRRMDILTFFDHITFFYFLGKPSIHLLPSTDHLDALRYAQYMNGKLSFRKLQSGVANQILLKPEPGILAATFPEFPGEFDSRVRC